MASKFQTQKYPKTPHLPFSPEHQDDDVVLSNQHCTQFVGQEVIITEKMDGGNCQLFQGKIFARTTNKEATHASFGPIKQLYSQFSFLIPDHLVLFGENMYGIHSIEYNNLKSYFYLFAILDLQDNRWYGWDEMINFINDNDLSSMVPIVPVLYRGTFTSLDEIKQWMDERIKDKKISQVGGGEGLEGFVIKSTQTFANKDFERNIAKYVRKGHIQTDENWGKTWKSAKINYE
ncbi:predicted protein [Naegleria gruberi]|uniref:Predicted protein n=1 Tax=Naegleria gruberi TaxID=5762 RepID=D2VCZ4_NAEGR|nr:uncharacterized protein NAEGRDRAFT_66741 [Naegleria gruberi]EFC45507.1 predicted protein [Naegleria gruberi]|eukprot:XP_002678251.1 predicted protein [Naegleria gruberi strain NEG-M]